MKYNELIESFEYIETELRRIYYSVGLLRNEVLKEKINDLLENVSKKLNKDI